MTPTMPPAPPAMERPDAEAESDDSGLSVTELMISAAIVVVLAAVVGSFFMDAFGSFGKTHRMSASAMQAHKGFLILDRQVRAAEAINRPVLVGSDWYVEFLTTASGTRECAQWRLVDSSDQLQTRTWTVSSGVATGVGAWRTVAHLVVNDPLSTSQQVFRFQAADSAVTKQSLLLHLVTRNGSTGQEGRAATQARLVARNSSPATSTNADADANGRSDAEVCQEVSRS